MALTATANLSTRKMIIQSLEMHRCYVKARNPNKTNIKYTVAEKPSEINSVVQPIVEHIRKRGREANRCIIFCRSYNDSSAFFEHLTLELARVGALLVGTVSGQKVRICEKFTACSSPRTKCKIVDSFTDPNGMVRVVVATVAFGMGIDSPNVREAIHWGPPEDLELYVQETGRGGRDNLPSSATLYYGKRDISHCGHCTESMKRYCENMSKCRRKLLMSQFTEEEVELPCYTHLCCDVCTCICMCNDCNPDVLSEYSQPGTPFSRAHDNHEISNLKSSMITPKSVQITLKEEMSHYRTHLMSKVLGHATTLVGVELTTGLTDKTIANIAENCSFIKCESDLMKYGVTSHLYCGELFSIVNKVLNNEC